MKIFRLTLFAMTVLAVTKTYDDPRAATVDATAGVTVVDALSIVKTDDLNIGAIVPNARRSGTVSVSAAGETACDEALTCLTHTVKPARFTLQGLAGYAYTVTLPREIVMSNGTSELKVTALTSSAGDGARLDRQGLSELTVGGSVRIAARQEAGDYEGQFHVTVEYN